ncbi:hypothetical protein LJC27_03215 [Christensenellaceae bacterium OttesenSCG-928-M15]|nr:hypothetical protein [Christensenellaceae bacterium OttesenSCG-928-M15]
MKTYNCLPHCGGGARRACCLMKIETPAPFERLEQLDIIEGMTNPCGVVDIFIDDHPPMRVTADECGVFRVMNPYALTNGTHRILARGCPGDCCARRCFYIDACSLTAEPVDARMGATFRTIDIDVLLSGTTGMATVYYLLLPPGSPAPSATEVMNYQNTAALLDGTAATGQFITPVTATPTMYTWALTGLDNPGAPAGTTGVIDGYRYDVYIYVVSGACNSGVLPFDDSAVMGMPFATGLGTPDNPFTIRELTWAELQMYPDLIANNPLNAPGVDENARQLENIERLVTLYERTNGYYGLADSMALSYLMTSDINLSNYAAAYDGAGWESIGDIDGWINDTKETEHLFSGVFDGGDHTITNLSITPTATDDYFVGYRGLFGGVEEGTIKNLTLSGVTIDAFTTAPGFAQLGSFISTSRNPTLTALTLVDANITADCDTSPFGDPHMINIGGFVGAIFEGATVKNIDGQNISIAVPSAHALALGGFVGYTDKFSAYDRYEDIRLDALTISGYAMVGGFAGYIVYGVNLIRNATLNDVTLIAPGGEAGGLIGRLYVYGDTGNELIENCTVEDIFITLGGGADPGSNIGGLIGLITQTPFPTGSDEDMFPSRVFGERPQAAAPAVWPTTMIRRCAVENGTVNATNYGGGLVGQFNVSGAGDASTNAVTLCKTNVTVLGSGSNIGGLIGYSNYLSVIQSFTRGTVSTVGAGYGGLVGGAYNSVMEDSYATGAALGGYIGGGGVGEFSESILQRLYSSGNVTALTAAGGIAARSSGGAIQNSLVLGGVIQAATPHRVLGVNNGGTALAGNYALDTVIPIPGVADPSGLDGGTIASAQIVTTMQSLGWNTATIWNTATVAALGRPTLLQNPE